MRNMRVYYFTLSAFAISNIAMRRIKISRLQDLNDPFELLAVNLAEITEREKIMKIKDDVNKTSGLICFSISWKNPLLWGHYAEKHAGIALGFDVKDEMLVPVLYANKLKYPDFDPETGKLKQDDLLNLLRTKFNDWQYEKEVRLFVGLDVNKKESDMYFEPFTEDLQLREIVLGPKCELPIKAMRTLVNDYTPKVDVIT